VSDTDAETLWVRYRLFAPNLDGTPSGDGLRDGLPWRDLSEADKERWRKQVARE